MLFAALFGIMGMVLLILAWLIPVDASDRIIAAAIGSVGLLVAVVRIPIFKRNARVESEQPHISIEAEEKY
jgi:NhaP-type Na+/H+ or K+/H+ antiporter